MEDIEVDKGPKDDIMEATMMNPIILHTIFRHLPVKSLKNVRSVCKDWNKVATPLLGKRTVVFVNRLFVGLDRKPHTTSYHLPIHPLVSKNFALVYHASKDYAERLDDAKNGNTITRNFIKILRMRAKRVEVIHMNIDHYFFPWLVPILDKIPFKALREIAIRENYHENVGGTCCFSLKTNLTPIPTLEVLMLYAAETQMKRDGDTRTKLGLQYHALYQALLNNAPNLRRLEILGQNFYPDLTRCSKLKQLEWVGVPFKINSSAVNNLPRERDFNCDGLIAMLDGVKSSLEMLELGCMFKIHQDHSLRRVSRLPTATLAIPSCFPKLVQLSIDDILVYKDISTSLTKSRFPALKRLTLIKRNNDEQDLINSLKIENCFPNVESICLNQLAQPKFSLFFNPALKTLFPNVKQFGTGFDPQDNPGGNWLTLKGPGRDMLLRVFNTFLINISQAFVHLSEITVQVPFTCSLTELMEAICIPDVKGLKKLKLIIGFPSLVSDRGCNYEDFHRAFSLYRSITFDGFKMSEDTAVKMHNCAQVHNTDIYFNN